MIGGKGRGRKGRERKVKEIGHITELGRISDYPSIIYIWFSLFEICLFIDQEFAT